MEHRASGLRAIVALVMTLVGCDAATPPVQSTDAGMIALTPPSPPALPALGPCVEGDATVEHTRGPATCERWSEGPRPSCGSGMVPSAGGACAPLGGECAPPTPEPEGRVVLHVDAAAPLGGDGSALAPLPRIADALGVRAHDVTIVLAPGVHEGGVSLGDGVTLQGSCVADTTVTLGEDASEARSVLRIEGAGVRVRDLRVHGPGHIGVAALSGSDVELERVAVEGARLFGVACMACGLRAHDLLVRDVVGAPTAGTRATGGYGVHLEGARGELTRVTVERASEIGALFVSGTVAGLHDVRVLDTRTGPTGLMGVGVGVSMSASVRATRLWVEGAARGGIVVESHATLDIDDVVIRDVDGLALERPLGWAAMVAADASLRARRLWAADVTGGVEVAGGAATLEDVRLDRVHGQSHDGLVAGTWGVALRAVGGGSLHASRVHVEDVSDLALVAHEASELIAEDLVVHAVHGAFTPDGPLDQTTGNAVLARGGASVRITRAELSELMLVGVGATEPGTTLELEDAVIRDVAEGPAGIGGRALLGVLEASVHGRRVRVERAHELAVSAWLDAEVSLEDLSIVDTRARRDGRGGIAAGAYGGGTISLDGFEIRRASLVGIQLAHGATAPMPGAPANAQGGHARLSRGMIAEAPIGLHVQVDTDLAALVESLSFDEVERRVVADEMPVPGADLSPILEP